MTVAPTTMTVAEFCQQYLQGQITIDRSYQRSPNWPAAARSFLIDTILVGYPIPKLSIVQVTDLRTMKTIKYVVDGQQRTNAIIDFYQNKLRISTKNSQFSGKLLNQLEPEDQQRFLAYPVGIDLFTGATDQDIRELFRRVNWYTAPLNAQEKRHAQYAGEFKQFIAQIAHDFGAYLSQVGTFNDAQLSRMADASFFAECSYTYLRGVDHASEAKLNRLYNDYDQDFPDRQAIYGLFASALQRMSQWDVIAQSHLSRAYNLYSLLVAVMHCIQPGTALAEFPSRPFLPNEQVIEHLLMMNQALDVEEPPTALEEYVQACAKATNRLNQRSTRLGFFIAALTLDGFPSDNQFHGIDEA